MFGSMPLVAPVFLQTDQIDSSISVVNAITFAVNGTVTLRDQAGTIIGQQTISFPAHSSTPVAMKSLLTAAGSQAHSGSVTLEQDPALKGPALLAQLSMTLHTGSQAAFLEEEFGMPTAHGSATLQGVASQTRNLPLIAITSVSDAAQTIHASCIGENTASSSIELPAYGTAVVQACSWQGIPDAALNLSSSLLNGTGSTITDHALSLKSDSVPGAFYAFGFALSGGLDQAQLQPVDFYDPGLLPTSAISYVGVPIGVTNLLAAALSAPTLTLANFSGQPRQATVTWADSSSGTPKVQPIASLTLAPFSTQTTTLSTPGGSGLLNTFTITSNGQPGDVQAHLFTRMGTSQTRTELLAKDAHDDHNGGDHPWSTANNDHSTLLLFNSGAKVASFHVRISGRGNTWVESYKLAPSETKAISINDIASDQIADRTHRSLPRNLNQGEVQWNTEFGGTGLGRLLVTNTSTALTRSFSCPTYTNMCASQFGPENYEDLLLEGDPVNLSQVQPIFCTEYCPNCCGQTSPVGSSPAYSFSTSWTVSNYSGVTSQISSSNSDILLKGINIGTFYVDAEGEAGSCQAGARGGGTVINVTTSPSAISMSSGDTSVNITVNVNPSSSASSASFALNLQNNPNSSSTATVGFNPPSSFTGNDNWTISVSGSNSPSGIFQARACINNVCSQNPTTITVPPQVIVQVLYGEAHGQAAIGDSVSEPAIASSITQRLNNPRFGSPSTWQQAITPQQFNGISTQVTTGQEPELDVAVSAYTGSLQDGTSGSPCFFTPTAAGFAAIQATYNSSATSVPAVSADPLCYGDTRQLVWKTSIGNNANGNGAPAFIFERNKIGSAAVVQIP